MIGTYKCIAEIHEEETNTSFHKVMPWLIITKFDSHEKDSKGLCLCCGRASFELELGAAGQRTDFKESNKMLEWSLKKASVESLTWFASLGILNYSIVLP